MSPELYRHLLLIDTASTWWMAGLVWFCAIVHYPLFDAVGHDQFRQYHAMHVRRTQCVVILPMFLELLSTFAIALFPPDAAKGSWLPSLGAGLVVSVWLCTFFRQVPDHETLSHGFDTKTHQRLLRGNLLRSFLWTGHAVVVSLQCHHEMSRF